MAGRDVEAIAVRIALRVFLPREARYQWREP